MVKTEERLMAMYANANPVELEDLLNMVGLDNAEYLATPGQRSSEVTQQDTKEKGQQKTKPALSWLIAAALAIVAGVGVIMVNQDNNSTVAATNPPTTQEAIATPVDPADAAAFLESAEASVDAWFDGYNTGDDDAVLGLFAPGVAVSASIGGISTLEEWTMLLAWNTAQGTLWTPQTCTSSEPEPGLIVTVVCSTGNRDALTRAVDALSVPTTMVATVTAEGISDLRFGIGDLDFNHVRNPFTVWLSVNHPDVVEANSIEFGHWATIEEARLNGLLTAQYAAEWATYLAENSCSYLDGC